MPSINSFVFFDTETTGLPGCDPPKITELAFVACSREHLLSPNKDKNKIPRVIFKLLLPFHPLKMIHPEATRVTHLDNWLLENCKPLDGNTVDMMKCFFSQLNKPICLVAHNGNGFDYPILKRHLKKLDSSFDDDLLCVDSLEIFKEIDKSSGAGDSAIEAFLSTNPKAMQRLNEKTPSKPKSVGVVSKFGDQKPSSARCLFPSSSNSTNNTPSSSTANTQNNSNGNTSTAKANSSPKISYKLTEIFKRLIGCEPEDAHCAEADAMFILKCAVATKDNFVAMADSMAINFNDTQFK